MVKGMGGQGASVESRRAELALKIAAQTPGEGDAQTAIAGLRLYRRSV